MTQRPSDLPTRPELKDRIRQEKKSLSYSDFLTEVFDYMQNNAKCYNEFQSQIILEGTIIGAGIKL